MKVLNRSLFTVTPRQPLLDWLKQHGEEYTMQELQGDTSAYLVDEDPDSDDDGTAALEACYGAIFEHELAGWMADRSAWPAERDLELFREWFTVEFHSMVIDRGGLPLQLEDM